MEAQASRLFSFACLPRFVILNGAQLRCESIFIAGSQAVLGNADFPSKLWLDTTVFPLSPRPEGCPYTLP